MAPGAPGAGSARRDAPVSRAAIRVPTRRTDDDAHLVAVHAARAEERAEGRLAHDLLETAQREPERASHVAEVVGGGERAARRGAHVAAAGPTTRASHRRRECHRGRRVAAEEARRAGQGGGARLRASDDAPRRDGRRRRRAGRASRGKPRALARAERATRWPSPTSDERCVSGARWSSGGDRRALRVASRRKGAPRRCESVAHKWLCELSPRIEVGGLVDRARHSPSRPSHGVDPHERRPRHDRVRDIRARQFGDSSRGILAPRALVPGLARRFRNHLQPSDRAGRAVRSPRPSPRDEGHRGASPRGGGPRGGMPLRDPPVRRVHRRRARRRHHVARQPPVVEEAPLERDGDPRGHARPPRLDGRVPALLRAVRRRRRSQEQARVHHRRVAAPREPPHRVPAGGASDARRGARHPGLAHRRAPVPRRGRRQEHDGIARRRGGERRREATRGGAHGQTGARTDGRHHRAVTVRRIREDEARGQTSAARATRRRPPTASRA